MTTLLISCFKILSHKIVSVKYFCIDFMALNKEKRSGHLHRCICPDQFG